MRFGQGSVVCGFPETPESQVPASVSVDMMKRSLIRFVVKFLFRLILRAAGSPSATWTTHILVRYYVETSLAKGSGLLDTRLHTPFGLGVVPLPSFAPPRKASEKRLTGTAGPTPLGER